MGLPTLEIWTWGMPFAKVSSMPVTMITTGAGPDASAGKCSNPVRCVMRPPSGTAKIIFLPGDPVLGGIPDVSLKQLRYGPSDLISALLERDPRPYSFASCFPFKRVNF